MSTAVLLYPAQAQVTGKKSPERSQSGTELDVILFDATMQQTHVTETEVTEHPVETGANVTDHIRVKPAEVSLECIITPFKLGTMAPDAGPGLQGVPDDSQQPQASNASKTRVEDAYRRLLALKDAAQPVSLTAGVRSYENMAITSIAEHRTNDTGNSIYFTLRLKEIRFASTGKVETIPKAAGVKNKGAKTPSEADAKVKEKTKLKALVDWAAPKFVPNLRYNLNIASQLGVP